MFNRKTIVSDLKAAILKSDNFEATAARVHPDDFVLNHYLNSAADFRMTLVELLTCPIDSSTVKTEEEFEVLKNDLCDLYYQVLKLALAS